MEQKIFFSILKNNSPYGNYLGKWKLQDPSHNLIFSRHNELNILRRCELSSFLKFTQTSHSIIELYAKTTEDERDYKRLIDYLLDHKRYGLIEKDEYWLNIIPPHSKLTEFLESKNIKIDDKGHLFLLVFKR
jgi:hypothetical protein